MRQLHYSGFHTAADADVLGGTELETAPGNGVYKIAAASTVNTATLAVSGSVHSKVSDARSIVLRAGPVTDGGDEPWIQVVAKGERVKVDLAGTTGTVFITASYLGR